MTNKFGLLTKLKTDKSAFSAQTTPNAYQSPNKRNIEKVYTSTNKSGLIFGIPPQPQPPQTTTSTTSTTTLAPTTTSTTSTTTLAPTTTSTTTLAPTTTSTTTLAPTTTSTTTVAPTTTTSTTSTTTVAPTTTTTSTTTVAPTTTSTTSTTTLAPTTTSTTTVAPTTTTSTTSTTTLAPTTTTSTTSTTTVAPTTTTSTTSTTTLAPTTTSTTTTTTIAPNTFNVTNNGSGNYVINGSSNPTLSIIEGQTYIFNINAVGHPFWIKTVSSTGTGFAYSSGVTNNGIDNGTITFVVPYNAPSTLYYNCQFHLSMAGTINVTDVPTTTTTTTTTSTTSTTTLAPTTTSTTTLAPTTTSTTSTTTLAPTTTTSTTTVAPTTTTSTTSTSTTTSTPANCPAISNTIRLATLADVGVIPNASVGDLLVFGPNDGTGIFLRNDRTPIIASLAPGAKILIRGGYSYSFIGIDTNLAGTLANPIVITNFCGQITTRNFTIVGMSYFKLTGKYDPANKTGDINYQGHAAGYAWSQGKYGIFVTKDWTDVDTSLLSITSGIPIGSSTISRTDNYEVEYIEAGNGGYSNAFRWDDNNTSAVLNNIRIHDNYFHDIAGEAIYMGIAASRKAGYEIFENLKVYNNRILRTGAEGIQIKRIGSGSAIYNNTTINTGLGGQDSQNFATVLWPVNGNTSVNNNLFVGNSGYSPVQWYIVNDPQYVPSATTASFVRNAMLRLGVDDTVYAGIRGFFMKGLDVVNDVNIPNVPPIAQEISSNYWGFFDSLPIYANEALVDNNYTPIPTSPVYARNNTYTQKNTFWGGAAPTISTNNVSGTVNDVSFVNFSYGVDFDWSRFRRWNSALGTNFTTGWYVTYKSKIYKAIANSSNVEPGVTAGWQTYWELQTYNGGSSFYPADDVRVSTGNFYNTNNIGLVDKP